MCGRFTQFYTWAEVHEFLSVCGPARNLRPRYIAPTDTVDVVLDRAGDRAFEQMRWGLVPGWWKKALKQVPATFNARRGSVTAKPMFRGAYRSGRRWRAAIVQPWESIMPEAERAKIDKKADKVLKGWRTFAGPNFAISAPVPVASAMGRRVSKAWRSRSRPLWDRSYFQQNGCRHRTTPALGRQTRRSQCCLHRQIDRSLQNCPRRSSQTTRFHQHGKGQCRP